MGRFIELPWAHQPPAGVRARELPGMMGVWLGSARNGQLGNELVTPSGVTSGVGPVGQGVTFGTYAGSGRITLPNEFRFVGSSGTIIVGAYCGLWTSGEFPHIWSIRDGSTQIAAFVIDNNIANRYLTLTVGASTLNGPSYGRPYDANAVLAASFGAAGMRLYQDGALVASNSTTTTPASTGIAPCLGNRSTGGRGFANSSAMYWAAFFDRHIGDEMHARIAADPYGALLEPRRIWVPQAAASGLPTLSAATLVNAGGNTYQPRVTYEY